MKLDKFFARFEKKPLNVYVGLCSSNRDRKSACRECAGVCPRGLLKIGELGLNDKIDLTECNSCGLCATVCPNGVFEVREPTDIALVHQIESLLEKKKNADRRLPPRRRYRRRTGVLRFGPDLSRPRR